MDYALGRRVERRVRSRRSRKPYLLNLMWPLMGSGHATQMYEGLPHMLDQFLVNRGMLDRDSPIQLARIKMAGRMVPYVGIVNFEDMEIESGSHRKGPRRFGRPAKSYDPDGFSDHFPIAVKLIEEEQTLA